MRVLICGSRDWRNYEAIRSRLDELCAKNKNVEVVVGGATGADNLGENIARTLRLVTHLYPARWDLHGKRAGLFRNMQMLDEMEPDLVLAFWDGQSRGTQHTVSEAQKLKIPVEVHLPDGKVMTWPES